MRGFAEAIADAARQLDDLKEDASPAQRATLEKGGYMDQLYHVPAYSRSTVYLNGIGGNVGGVAAVFTSGNRDEDVFENPDEFDLNRRKKDLLTFGRGPHMCPGAPLARLLLIVAIEGIVRLTRRIEIAGEMTMTNWPEYGPLAVPIKLVR